MDNSKKDPLVEAEMIDVDPVAGPNDTRGSVNHQGEEIDKFIDDS